MNAPEQPPASPGSDSDLVRAAQRRPVTRTPVWFMRQAGRSLPEYREIRATVPMLESCQTPDLVTQITLQPVRRHGVDAAILFSDIVVPLVAAGVEVDIVAGVGPVVEHPVRTYDDVAAIAELTPDRVDYVTTAVTQLVRELGLTPLIGFAGAPFTLASYLVEGGPSRTHARTKALMHAEPELWHTLCAKLARVSATFLQVQVDAGASAVQLFDSWAGALSRADYVRYVQEHSRTALAAVAGRVPRIHFGVGTGELLPDMGAAGAEVVGVDFRVDLADASARIGDAYAVQGNLDPALVLARWPVIESEVRRIVAAGRTAPGHIFNLGHGVLPESDPGVLTAIVDLVHELSPPS